MRRSRHVPITLVGLYALTLLFVVLSVGVGYLLNTGVRAVLRDPSETTGSRLTGLVRPSAFLSGAPRFFGLSLFVDVVPWSVVGGLLSRIGLTISHVVLEDTLKLLGIVTYCAYYVSVTGERTRRPLTTQHPRQ